MIVHFPLAISLLFPLTAIFFFLEIQLKRQAARGWLYVFGLAIFFFFSTFAASQLGEREEDVVAKFVPEGAIHEHEQKAEWLLVLAGISVVVSAVPLLARSEKLRQIGYSATILIGFATTAAAVFAGHSGASLVYEKGAADGYIAKKSGESIFETPVQEDMNEE